ncbi:MAG: glutaredoxin family protein [Proteobacteria bacterium]|nr:glutaredoxin family protein [Pseudomonadota bacterium]
MQVAAAINVFECEDATGNRSFYKICPPGSIIVDEYKLTTGVGNPESFSNTSINATLYTVPDCDTYDEVREFLQNRKITITEKNVAGDLNNQNELTELTGSLKVPTVIIGDQTVVAYNRAELKAALDANGYTEKEGS